MRKQAAVAAAALAIGCGGHVAEPNEGCALGHAEPPREAGPPSSLAATGLYCDSVDDVRSGVLEYTPRFPLWADGAEQRRFLELPPGMQIDTDDEDGWLFPVGTRFWKEISAGGKRVETRLAERFGPGDKDWTFAAYEWRDDGSDAVPVPGGASNVRGTSHDIPDVSACLRCHGSRPERVLGFSAVQVGGTELLKKLSASERLTHAIDPTLLAGDPSALAALGYLHANCGHCHDAESASDGLGLGLRLTPETTDVNATQAYRTTLSVPTAQFRRGTPRVLPGDPQASALVTRMSARGNSVQMPPIGTEVVDHSGLASVARWIEGLR